MRKQSTHPLKRSRHPTCKPDYFLRFTGSLLFFTGPFCFSGAASKFSSSSAPGSPPPKPSNLDENCEMRPSSSPAVRALPVQYGWLVGSWRPRMKRNEE